MTLNEYQEKAMTTCLQSSSNFPYMAFNLVGEVGEFMSKIAKGIRKKKIYIGGDNTDVDCFIEPNELCDAEDPENRVVPKDMNEELMKEAGDILWQLAGLCNVMGWDLEEVAKMNLEKLQVRKVAGTIDGSGDGNTKEEGRE